MRIHGRKIRSAMVALLFVLAFGMFGAGDCDCDCDGARARSNAESAAR
jgi:hypothetical protein